jgi:hypothetical protein
MCEAVVKTITGTCAEISERGDWTTFHIDVGSQYPVKLSTKLAPLVELGRAASKDGGAFDWTFKESQGAENPHKPGTHYTNRYLDAVESAGTRPTPDTAPQGVTVSTQGMSKSVTAEGMSKEDWARKDSAIHKMACIKTAADALKHTIPSDPSQDDLAKFITRCVTLSQAWHRSVIAERDDPTGEDIPF